MSSQRPKILAPDDAPPDRPFSETDESPVPQRETSRDIHLAVWNLAWPSVATMLLQTVNSMLDAFFVGHLENGRQSLAATGRGGAAFFFCSFRSAWA